MAVRQLQGAGLNADGHDLLGEFTRQSVGEDATVRVTCGTDVLRVDPVYDDQGQPTATHEECYDEQVPVQGQDNRAGATVLGAVIGGVVGSTIGKGNGRTAATVAGAAAGAAVGNNAGQPASGYTVERRCRQVEGPGGERHASAYDVEYRYRGELYNARMSYDPGDRIRVRISVTPAE